MEQENTNNPSVRSRDLEDDDAYEKVATLIAAKVPLSKRTDITLLPSELPDTAEHWISNFADGMASTGECTQEEAIKSIRAAFENKYGMTPEEYTESYVPEQKHVHSDGFECAAEAAARHEVDRPRENDRASFDRSR